VIVNDGLEEIDVGAFHGCRSLECIAIPPTVKAIMAAAFHWCSRLTAVDLGDGLEEIQDNSFAGCTSLVRIVIPLAIRVIG